MTLIDEARESATLLARIEHGEAIQAALATIREVETGGTNASRIRPVDTHDRTSNPLRPHTLDEMIGQTRLKPLMRRVIDASKAQGRPLDHLLLVGSSGTGKTTLAHVMANELGVRVFQLDAPITQDQLAELREVMQDGEILFVDEIHRQVAGDRRGVTAAAQPEIFYHVLEDRVLTTAYGVEPFPEITVIGATTDAGLLPEPFLARFPLQPRLDPYTVEDMIALAKGNAQALGLTITPDAAELLAEAARANPRQMNRYMRNARTLTPSAVVDRALAHEVVVDLNSTTLDGLTLDMATMLRYLYLSGKRVKGDGTVVYQASVSTIATALGKSRDTKAVSLYVEPYLIERGYVQVAASVGRILTDAGIDRARKLTST